MSNFVNSGTLTTNTTSGSISVHDHFTVALHNNGAGTAGTMTLQFAGPDGVWRTFYEGTTAVTATANYMNTFYVGDDVSVRVSLSGSSGTSWAWQLLSNPMNSS
jgi:hypothetical protein